MASSSLRVSRGGSRTSSAASYGHVVRQVPGAEFGVRLQQLSHYSFQNLAGYAPRTQLRPSQARLKCEVGERTSTDFNLWCQEATTLCIQRGPRNRDRAARHRGRWSDDDPRGRNPGRGNHDRRDSRGFPDSGRGALHRAWGVVDMLPELIRVTCMWIFDSTGQSSVVDQCDPRGVDTCSLDAAITLEDGRECLTIPARSLGLITRVRVGTC